MRRRALDDVDRLSDPVVISGLLGRDVNHVERTPFETTGWSSTEASFVGLRIDGEQRPSLVIKIVDRSSDWVAIGTRDDVAREVRVWECGLLDTLVQPASHAVVGSARTADQYALLMHSVSDGLLENGQVNERVHHVAIEAMTAVQAGHWQSDGLLDPEVGLSTLALFAGHTSPSTVDRIVRTMGRSAVTDYITDGRQRLASLMDSGLAADIAALADEPARLIDRVSSEWWTLAHGDLRPPNVALSGPSMVLLDWARPMPATPTLDLLYWLFWANPDHPVTNDRLIERHRLRLQTRLGTPLDEQRWREEADIAAAVVFVTMAQFVAPSPPPAFEWWAERTSRVIAGL